MLQTLISATLVIYLLRQDKAALVQIQVAWRFVGDRSSKRNSYCHVFTFTSYVFINITVSVGATLQSSKWYIGQIFEKHIKFNCLRGFYTLWLKYINFGRIKETDRNCVLYCLNNRCNSGLCRLKFVVELLRIYTAIRNLMSNMF